MNPIKQKKINDITIHEPRTAADKMLFSYIKSRITEMNFGKLQVTLTVKNGEVTMIRETSERTVSIQNDNVL